jgi:hypothetical protein
MRRIAAVIAVVVCLVALGATSAHAGTGAAQSVPPTAALRDFFGLVSEDAFQVEGAYRQMTLATQASLGVGLLRETFDWSRIEVSPGNYDFRWYDQFVADTARAGIAILPVVFRTPTFRGGVPGVLAYPPTNYADLGAFAAVLVRRYGPDGTFWSENPSVPRMPIRAWQIWNEPNLKAYWPRGPNPKQYAKLLKAAAAPIKAADPGAEIVTAGMPESKVGVPLGKFIPALYKAGAKKWFDTMAINPYGHTAARVDKNLAAVRKIMRKYHDKAPIWATEVGWSDTGPGGPQLVGPAGQATQVGNLVRILVRDRRRLNLRGVVYYAWRDAPPYSDKDFWGLHTGLLTLDGQPKPAYFALQASLAAALRNR